jgi:tetratricopeptide (TPR) repeat protein
LNYGIRQANKGEFQQAAQAFCQAIQLNPKYSNAYNNLGLVLHKMNRLEEAKACLCRAIELKPNYPYAYNNLSLILIDTNRLEEAEACLRRAIELDPNFSELYNNLGLVLEDTTRIAEAEKSYRRAIFLNPKYAEAHYNLGRLFKSTRRLAEAEIFYHRALKLHPGYSAAEFALAVLYLLQGDFTKVWEKYDKFRTKKSKRRQGEIPCWQGEDLTGCSILLFHEQGFGDTVQFVRYVQKVAEAASQTVLWIQKPLAVLLAASYHTLTIHVGEDRPREHYDFACPLPRLPMVFNTALQTIPQIVPYLQSVPEVSAAWRKTFEAMDSGKRYRGGVVWAGNPRHINDRSRSIPFALFRKLFDSSEINWVSLQVGERASDAAEAPCNVVDLSPKLVDFSQTAGAIANLDLVITVDSAVAHLAGAMGKKTWVLLPFVPDWRWQLEREDSPWYPTVRLFRQSKLGDWPEVLIRVKEAIEKEINELK